MLRDWYNLEQENKRRAKAGSREHKAKPDLGIVISFQTLSSAQHFCRSRRTHTHLQFVACRRFSVCLDGIPKRNSYMPPERGSKILT